jgi:hypothetical protein
MGVDSSNVASGRGRNSVRITSKKSYNEGLIILDLAHMPGGACGEWPAFWTVGPNWPSSGEIDIIEGVNSQVGNSMALHTTSGCSIGASSNMLGTVSTSNCDVNAPGQANNAGCGITTSDPSTYGTGFNQAGGGVYATEWTSSAIKIWIFSRSNVPADIASGNPNPSNWGSPTSIFSSPCQIGNYFRNQQIVFDVTFCGDWAGGVWNQDATCSAKAGSCADYVRNNPQAYKNSFWSINSLRVYNSNGIGPNSFSAPASSAGSYVPQATGQPQGPWGGQDGGNGGNEGNGGSGANGAVGQGANPPQQGGRGGRPGKWGGQDGQGGNAVAVPTQAPSSANAAGPAVFAEQAGSSAPVAAASAASSQGGYAPYVGSDGILYAPQVKAVKQAAAQPSTTLQSQVKTQQAAAPATQPVQLKQNQPRATVTVTTTLTSGVVTSTLAAKPSAASVVSGKSTPSSNPNSKPTATLYSSAKANIPQAKAAVQPTVQQQQQRPQSSAPAQPQPKTTSARQQSQPSQQSRPAGGATGMSLSSASAPKPRTVTLTKTLLDNRVATAKTPVVASSSGAKGAATARQKGMLARGEHVVGFLVKTATLPATSAVIALEEDVQGEPERLGDEARVNGGTTQLQRKQEKEKQAVQKRAYHRRRE